MNGTRQSNFEIKTTCYPLGNENESASLVQFNANMVNVVFACNLLLKERHLFGFLSISVLFACDFDYQRNKESF